MESRPPIVLPRFGIQATSRSLLPRQRLFRNTNLQNLTHATRFLRTDGNSRDVPRWQEVGTGEGWAWAEKLGPKLYRTFHGVFPSFEDTAVQTRDYFQNGEFPSSHHREEGWPSDQENIAQHPLFARTRWCSDRWDKEHHPGGVHKEASRHFLVTPPPLLAVMRGGEFALFKMRRPNHISLCRPL